ncbi:MAG: hypothetical protein N3D17_05435, partial [bacterium]|nr:hypothetical protein [bacterium]
VCISNMKQIGLACTMYADDYSEYLPGGFNGENYSPEPWVLSLSGYVPRGIPPFPVLGSSILKCPSNRKPQNNITSYGPAVGEPGFGGICAGGLCNNDPALRRLAKRTQVKYPSQTVYWVEIDNTEWTHGITPSIWSTRFYHTIHNGGSNVLFVDGHVIWVRAEEWQSAGPTSHSWYYHFCLDYPKPQW